jgi:hypothetical protein
MLVTLLLIASTAAAMYVAYMALHAAFPSWGTVLTNAAAGLGMLADFINALPWGSVLDSKETGVVLFAGAALANIAMRLSGNKAKVGAG